jgi:hypothetical protein
MESSFYSPLLILVTTLADEILSLGLAFNISMMIACMGCSFISAMMKQQNLICYLNLD